MLDDVALHLSETGGWRCAPTPIEARGGLEKCGGGGLTPRPMPTGSGEFSGVAPARPARPPDR